MKKLFLLFFFFSCSLGSAVANFLQAQDHERPPPRYYNDGRYSSPHGDAPAPSEGSGDLFDSIVGAFLGQGITGAMLIVIGFYLYRTENQARDDRNELTRKLEDLVIRSQDNLVEVKTEVSGMKAEISGIRIEMGNQGREMESIRDFLMSKHHT
jgi:hypothetical protein